MAHSASEISRAQALISVKERIAAALYVIPRFQHLMFKHIKFEFRNGCTEGHPFSAQPNFELKEIGLCTEESRLSSFQA